MSWDVISDEKYGSFSTNLTAMVLYTRSGNEKSLKHVKHSKVIVERGEGKPRFDVNMLSDIWLAWGISNELYV